LIKLNSLDGEKVGNNG